LIFGRRVTFALIVAASQMLLIAVSITLFIELILIVKYGSVNFMEKNRSILVVETVAAAMISAFALSVFVLQLKRLGERRKGERATGPPAVKN
jgi:hypothetical protein